MTSLYWLFIINGVKFFDSWTCVSEISFHSIISKWFLSETIFFFTFCLFFLFRAKVFNFLFLFYFFWFIPDSRGVKDTGKLWLILTGVAQGVGIAIKFQCACISLWMGSGCLKVLVDIAGVICYSFDNRGSFLLRQPLH